MRETKVVALLLALLGTGAFASDVDPGVPAVPIAAKPRLGLSVEAPKSLSGTEAGEDVVVDVLVVNGAVFSIRGLTLDAEADMNLEVKSGKRAVFRDVSGTGGKVRTRVRCKLRGQAGVLTVNVSARFSGDEEVNPRPVKQRLTIPIGHQQAADKAPNAVELRDQVFTRSRKALQVCWEQAPIRKGRKDDVYFKARLDVDGAGSVKRVSLEGGWAPPEEIEPCVRAAIPATGLPATGRPSEVELPIILLPTGEVLLQHQLVSVQ